MDDDDLRRGRPTLHRHAGEAMAILAGDALLGLGVELVTDTLKSPELVARVCRELIVGCNNMIAGQVWDTLAGVDPSIEPLERLRRTHRNKTGALIRAACRMGAVCGGAGDADLDALTRYGEAVGLMFQVVDDVLDVTQSTEQLGKTAGKDLDHQTLTYPSLLGLDASREEIERLRREARDALAGLDDRAEPLRQLSDYLAVRTR
jgi:geranylgeranyl diphosphate synthase type II